MVNQHPEQLARDKIDQKLQEAGSPDRMNTSKRLGNIHAMSTTPT